jgi:hypothetical protein
MRRATFLLTLSAFAIPLLAETSRWGFAPPDATVFAGIEWAKVGRGFEQFLRGAGVQDKSCFDLLTRVKRIEVAFVMRGQDAQMVAMLEGDFRQSDIRELARFTRTGKGARKNESFVSFVDAHRVLVGDRAEVLRAVERLKQPAQGLPAALAAAEPALRQGDFWLIGQLPNDIGTMLADIGKSAGSMIEQAPLAFTPPKPEQPKFAVVHGMGPEPVLTPVH